MVKYFAVISKNLYEYCKFKKSNLYFLNAGIKALNCLIWGVGWGGGFHIEKCLLLLSAEMPQNGKNQTYLSNCKFKKIDLKILSSALVFS